jgi:Mannosyltransferase putative
VQEVLWLDCDTFPLYALDNLFEDEEYRKTGAMFWGDFGDFFNERRVFNNRDVKSRNVNKKLFPMNAWYVRNGFDTGILLVDKVKRKREMAVLHEITQNFSDPKQKWRKLSMGDKDMWKVAWMFAGTNYTMAPVMGAIGSFDKSGVFVLTSQPKVDRHGTIIALHQLHRGNTNGLDRNFGKLHWWKLGGPPAFNVPSVTIEIDMRRPMSYVNGHRWRWEGMAKELSPSQMYYTSQVLLSDVYSMAEAWLYTLEDHDRNWASRLTTGGESGSAPAQESSQALAVVRGIVQHSEKRRAAWQARRQKLYQPHQLR